MHNIGSFENFKEGDKVFSNPLFKGIKSEENNLDLESNNIEYLGPNPNSKITNQSATRNSLEPLKLSVSTVDTDFNGDRTSRSKSDSISTQRNSLLSLQNDSENSYSKILDGSETSSIDRSKAHSSTSRTQKNKDEGNILNGFLFLVNKASNFWANKFTKNDSIPITEEAREETEIENNNKKKILITHEINANPNLKNNEEMNLCLETQKLQICSNTESIEESTSEKPSVETMKEESNILETKLKKKLSKCSTETNTDWKKLAKEFSSPSMSPNVLKEKFKNIKDSVPPKKTRFTHSEDIIIVKFYRKHGSNWEAISKYLPERTPSMIKNRFYSSIKKKNLLGKLMSEVEEEEGLTSENKTTPAVLTQSATPTPVPQKHFWSNPITSSNQIKVEEKMEMKPIENLYNENPIDYYSLTTRDANINQHPILCDNQTNWHLNMNIFNPYAFENPFESELQYRIADNKQNLKIQSDPEGNFLDVFHGSHLLDHHEKNEEYELKFPEFEDTKLYNFTHTVSENPLTEMPKIEMSAGSGLYNNNLQLDFSGYKLENQREHNDTPRNQIEPSVETEEKINLLKNRISSIQNLFFETKSELEKLQKCFNQN